MRDLLEVLQTERVVDLVDHFVIVVDHFFKSRIVLRTTLAVCRLSLVLTATTPEKGRKLLEEQ